MKCELHDNWLYGHVVDHDNNMIIFHTLYPQSKEYTDVVFSGVVVHHFEEQSMSRGEYPSNVLFGIEEADPTYVLEQYSDLLEKKRNYGWPISGYDNIAELAEILTRDNRKCFSIQGTVGLSGFIFAQSMTCAPRDNKWSLA